MKVIDDTVSVDTGGSEAEHGKLSDLLFFRNNKSVSECYREYVKLAIALGMSSYISEQELRRYLLGGTSISLNDSYCLLMIILGPVETEIYIQQLTSNKNNMLPEVFKILTKQTEKEKEARFKEAIKAEKYELFFCTDRKFDLLLVVKGEGEEPFYMGRLSGDTNDRRVEFDKVISFIERGGRIRSQGHGIPQTPYGLESKSAKAGKIVGLVKVGARSKKRIVIKGVDSIA
ncbi:hypothetical protein [Photobacterium leiognathi]|uniref:hypothetical protein n=1 Tax=Photobacterium leiognathi TaxID=553611 RepID=UPI0029819E06|nr:hypothetical protein [Photobacterium leiognathi]